MLTLESEVRMTRSDAIKLIRGRKQAAGDIILSVSEYEIDAELHRAEIKQLKAEIAAMKSYIEDLSQESLKTIKQAKEIIQTIPS